MILYYEIVLIAGKSYENFKKFPDILNFKCNYSLKYV